MHLIQSHYARGLQGPKAKVREIVIDRVRGLAAPFEKLVSPEIQATNEHNSFYKTWP